MPKTKRMAYDADFKVKAIALAEEKGNRRAAFELGFNEQENEEIYLFDHAKQDGRSLMKLSFEF